MTRRARTPATRRLLGATLLLAFTLLVAQGLGLWHAQVHGRAAHGEAGTVATGQGHDSGFAHEAGDGQCRLLDELTAPGATPQAPTVAVAAALPPRVARALPRARPGARWAHFQARAPPQA